MAHSHLPRKLILFDLDGTLADTAPDLAAAANQQRQRRHLPPLPYEQLRPVTGQGTQGLLHIALGMTPNHPEFKTVQAQFMADYLVGAVANTQLFPGIAALLEKLDHEGYPWGIVTNKLTHLTLPILTSLGLKQKSTIIVCGDTVNHPKPSPDPLLYAARQAGYSPLQCIYIGDDLRDVQAAHAAGMPIIVAGYGYGAEQGISLWGAEKCVNTPGALWGAIEALGD